MAAVPAYLYTTAIFEMDPASVRPRQQRLVAGLGRRSRRAPPARPQNAVLYVAVTAVTTFLLALAYNKTNESEFEKLARNMCVTVALPRPTGSR